MNSVRGALTEKPKRHSKERLQVRLQVLNTDIIRTTLLTGLITPTNPNVPNKVLSKVFRRITPRI